MRSSDGNRRSPWGRHWTAALRRTEPRPVWVNLSVAFGVASRDPDCYPLVGEVRGELYEWIRSTAGWVGVVEFHLHGFTGAFRQLVPSAALRERDDGRRLNGTRIR